ncbi:hypothetical protein CH53_2327 [Yersinia intermedia]|nr:hypothetical protein CH53_2327 [Yersinia intermedia]
MTRQHRRSPAQTASTNLRMTERERGKAQGIERAEHTSVCEHHEMTRQHRHSPAQTLGNSANGHRGLTETLNSLFTPLFSLINPA